MRCWTLQALYTFPGSKLPVMTTNCSIRFSHLDCHYNGLQLQYAISLKLASLMNEGWGKCTVK
jgi:hypothetical protein